MFLHKNMKAGMYILAFIPSSLIFTNRKMNVFQFHASVHPFLFV